MSTNNWTAIDAYIADHLVAPDPVLEAALVDGEAAGLPAIAVASNQGKLLHILALSIGASAFSRSERWAAIAPSGWPAPCPRTASW